MELGPTDLSVSLQSKFDLFLPHTELEGQHGGVLYNGNYGERSLILGPL